MKVAVVRFPGSNCDQDAFHSLRDDVGVGAEYVWYEETDLRDYEAVFLPGGFSYGDYLRCGAMAARAPVMDEVRRFAREGRPVIGSCNGFQILCEAGILPGALMRNSSEKFVCRDVWIEAQTRRSVWTSLADRPLKIPVAHGEGRYVCGPDGLKSLQDQDQIAFTYLGDEENPNGSEFNIAGVLNLKGNVLGLMPHPERATKPILGSCDGLAILSGLKLVAAG